MKASFKDFMTGLIDYAVAGPAFALVPSNEKKAT